MRVEERIVREVRVKERIVREVRVKERILGGGESRGGDSGR